jgi:GNAT superfamily N-acetyltransferase
MKITTMTLDDLAIADGIVIAAYPQHVSRAREIRRYLGLQPDGWFLAWEDGVAVGMGGVVSYDDFAYIGLIGVVPERQRQGVGMAVVRHILEWIDGQGIPMALLDASPAGAPLYERLGFVTDDQSEVWQHEAWTAFQADALADIISPNPDVLAALAAYDTPYFGTNRVEVLHTLMREYPGRTLLLDDRPIITASDSRRKARQASKKISLSVDTPAAITGFLIAQAQSIGPWVATTPGDAEALLRQALTFSYDSSPTVLVPAANGDALDLLRRYGFVRQRSLRHMRRAGRSGATGRSGASGTQAHGRQGIYGLASFTLG